MGPLMLPFRMGLGARLGTGRQLMSVVSRTDWVRAVTFLLEHDITGPVNLSLPEPVTNAAFTDAFGDALGRPTVLVAPSPALKLALGALSDDLLGSLGMVPARLLESGFTFRHPDLGSAMADAVADR